MTHTHDEALAVQRRHEARIMALPGVTGMGVKLVDGVIVIEVSVAEDSAVPPSLDGHEDLDGVPLHVVKRTYRLQ